jgi:hypothetical protein
MLARGLYLDNIYHQRLIAEVLQPKDFTSLSSNPTVTAIGAMIYFVNEHSVCE